MNVNLKSCVASMVTGLALMSVSANAFNISSSLWADGETTFNVNFAQSGDDNAADGVDRSALFQQSFIDSLNAWTQNSTFTYNVDVSAAIDPCDASQTGNGVRFDDDDCGDGYGQNVLAVASTSFQGSSRIRTGITFNTAVSWGVFVNRPPGSASIDFFRVAVHESGHSLGLNHEDVISPSIMRSSISNVRQPQADDLAGVAALYDQDADGVGFVDDNCRGLNNDQSDIDGDDIGDACDSDIDGDGIFNAATVDQTFARDNLSFSSFSVGDALTTRGLAQTFTVARAGELTSVSLPVFCSSGNLRILVRNVTAGGQPGSTLRDSVTFASESIPTGQAFLTADLSSGGRYLASLGERLAIVIESSGSCGWRVANSGSTDSGDGFFSNNGTSWFGLNRDLPFETQVLPAQLDNCPTVANADQADFNSDGSGDACDDGDGDQIPNGVDNCPAVANNDQANLDGDADGDECDNDIDGDGVLNGADDNPNNGSVCSDNDSDLCDDCSSGSFDIDNDGLDTDGNGICDIGDLDDDDDGIPDVSDNCPVFASSDTTDTNNNGIGDVCEEDDQLCFPVLTSSGRASVICL